MTTKAPTDRQMLDAYSAAETRRAADSLATMRAFSASLKARRKATVK